MEKKEKKLKVGNRSAYAFFGKRDERSQNKHLTFYQKRKAEMERKESMILSSSGPELKPRYESKVKVLDVKKTDTSYNFNRGSKHSATPNSANESLQVIRRPVYSKSISVKRDRVDANTHRRRFTDSSSLMF